MQVTTFTPIAGRFAWKEYRTLRGLWLAVAALGVVVQMLSRALAAPGADLPSIMLGMALGASIMYAVGAAAILFSVEHEEETYQFLSGLPMRWLPMTVGKLGVATLSALALAVVLALVGWMLGGGRWPSPVMASGLLALLGLGIFEALAWATLFSLLVKRPLTAVALALVVGTLVVQLASDAVSSSQPGALADLATYSRAAPLRMVIVAAVVAGVLFVARRWLASGTSARALELHAATAGLDSVRERMAQSQGQAATKSRGSRGRMLARLIWQTWRQSWKSLLIPFAVTGFLWLIAALLGLLIPRSPDDVMPLFGTAAFFLPALFGALVFSGDQRRRQYRFLAEHAARPRYVWLTRHVVWLGTMVCISFGFALAAALLTAVLVNSGMQAYVEHRQWTWSPPQALAYELQMGTMWVVAGTGLMGFGAMTAYAVGQVCSMIFRSEIIAAFLSLVLSVVVTAWSIMLLLWFLSGWWFLLPIAAGLFLATWLRAPDWIIERNSLRAWLKPALAIAAPLLLVAALLPPTRLAQVPDGSQQIEPCVLHYRAGNSDAARETAEMYERAGALRGSWQEAKLLERWSGPEFREDGYGVGGIDEKKIPADQLEDYYSANRAQQKLIQEALESAMKLAIEASQRPTCRFEVDWSAATIPTPYDSDFNQREETWGRTNSTFNAVMALAEDLSNFRWFHAEINVDDLVAALRMCNHLRQGQPTAVAVRVFATEERILASIADWVNRNEATTEELRELKKQLVQYLQHSTDDPVDSLVADHLLVRSVLTGKSVPLIFDQSPIPWPEYLAFVANELPWERTRALRALDDITLQNVSDGGELQQYLVGKSHFSWDTSTLQRWLRPRSGSNWPPWLGPQYLASTSYLTRLEYQARVPINEFYRQLAEVKVRRRALLIQIALLLYRRDHDRYPAALSELVPDYLEELPLDPYPGKPFNYSPFGLDLPLRRHAYSGSDLIPQETPLVWSVGPNNARLTRRESTSLAEGADRNSEPTEVRAEFYALVGVDIYWDNEPALVFPLPK